MQELFIYYRIAPGASASALPVVFEWQARLRAAHPALEARLLERPRLTETPAEEDVTWMETYAAPGTDLIATLRAELAAGPTLPVPGLVGARHAEVFVPCAW